jgi:GNAT superfamily N-acetyltransferase
VNELAIERATSERLPDLVGLLGRAFIADPLFGWPLGGIVTPEVIATMFEALYAEPIRRGMLWEAGEADGVAVWIPPGGATDLFDSDREAREGFASFLFDGGERYAAMWEWLEAQIPADLWYLDALAVEPLRQRTGVGGALIRHGLALAAADGVGVFLETARPANVGYYERFGFRVSHEEDVPGGGPHTWFMRRDRSVSG